MYLGHLRDQYIDLGTQILAHKKPFSKFLFSEKYVEVAINDFTIYPIVLEYKIADKKKKTMTQRGQSKRSNRSCKYSPFLLPK